MSLTNRVTSREPDPDERIVSPEMVRQAQYEANEAAAKVIRRTRDGVSDQSPPKDGASESIRRLIEGPDDDPAKLAARIPRTGGMPR